MSGAVEDFVPLAKEKGTFGTRGKDEDSHLPRQRWPRAARGMADWRTPAKILPGCRREHEDRCDSSACSSQNLGMLERICQTLSWPTWLSTQPDKPDKIILTSQDRRWHEHMTLVLINIKFLCYLLHSCIITGMTFSSCINEQIFPKLLSPSQGHFSWAVCFFWGVLLVSTGS